MATHKETQEISRRSFLKRTAIGGAGLVVAADVIDPDLFAAEKPKRANSTMIGVPFDARERVRLGIIGVGGRGTSLLKDLLAVESVEVKAICDLVPEKVVHAQKAVTSAGQPEPAGFSKGEWDFKNLTQLDLDIVYIATPWNWHVPMAVSAMKMENMPPSKCRPVRRCRSAGTLSTLPKRLASIASFWKTAVMGLTR